MKIIIATHNQHKIQEIKELLKDPQITVQGLDGLGYHEALVEDQSSFIGNARQKAQAIATIFPQDFVVADDSGFCVKALDMKPGVYSARFLGENEDDLAKNLKILELLENKSDRRALFCCAVHIQYKGQGIDVIEEVFGQVSEKLLGDRGFGYDPIFIPEGYEQSFAQIPEVKSIISHRAKAFRKVAQYVSFLTR